MVHIKDATATYNPTHGIITSSTKDILLRSGNREDCTSGCEALVGTRDARQRWLTHTVPALPH
ncbi:hypothetical protein HanRHA438_Chr11g0529081 [Helianthus annuus]|nr:hypothetical protein HanRHA438_Chr11g0529081 [Helianthus annuus]